MEITFWSYQLKGWDLDFIQKLAYKLELNEDKAEIDINTESNYYDLGSVIANQVISYLLTEGVLRHVKNGKDRDKLINSIYVDGIDSGYDIEKDELTEDWKAYLRKVDL